MLKRICKRIVLTLFPHALKRSSELAYWKARVGSEGELANDHYVPFYTTHFGLTLESYAGKRILDIGCGPRGSLEWAEMAAERVGLDPLAEEYLKLGATRHAMKYVASGSENMPFEDGHFDVVCSFNSLDHVDNLEQTIGEIGRVVKPGGLFLLLTDVNHNPTPTEPLSFSWDILDAFQPDFECLEERRFEKVENRVYGSLQRAVPYDESDSRKRYGILSAKLQRRQ